MAIGDTRSGETKEPDTHLRGSSDGSGLWALSVLTLHYEMVSNESQMLSAFVKPLVSASCTPYSRHDSSYESASSSGQRAAIGVAFVPQPPE